MHEARQDRLSSSATRREESVGARSDAASEAQRTRWAAYGNARAEGYEAEAARFRARAAESLAAAAH